MRCIRTPISMRRWCAPGSKQSRHIAPHAPGRSATCVRRHPYLAPFSLSPYGVSGSAIRVRPLYTSLKNRSAVAWDMGDARLQGGCITIWSMRQDRQRRVSLDLGSRTLSMRRLTSPVSVKHRSLYQDKQHGLRVIVDPRTISKMVQSRCARLGIWNLNAWGAWMNNSEKWAFTVAISVLVSLVALLLDSRSKDSGRGWTLGRKNTLRRFFYAESGTLRRHAKAVIIAFAAIYLCVIWLVF